MRAKKYLWSILCVYFCYLTHGIQAIILSQNNVNFAKQWGFNMTDPQSAAYAAGLAAVSRACNAFVNDNGVITGYITDGVGFVKNLEINGVSVKDKKIVVLGAGGAATAIQVQLALDGAKEVNIFNIKDKFYERAEGTKAKLAEKCPDCVVTVEDLADKAKLEEEIKTCDILINTTIMGMKPHEDVTLVDKSLFRKDLVVADTVYNPEKTKMILEAEEAGCKAIGGAGMLLQQGAVNYELFVGKEMPLAEYQEFQKAQAK